VASVLERLSQKNDRGWVTAGRIEDFLAAVSPGAEAAYTADLDGYHVVRFRQNGTNGEGPWDFTASEVSYGTLRTLGVLVAIYQGLTPGGSPVTLVGIEEPESAVHPGAATAILEAMDEASISTQILATTHSATMLDYEDFDLDIVRAVARINGRTIIGPVDVASRQIVDEGLSTAGALLRMRHLMPGEPKDDQPLSEPTAARA
jgi:predicted ATPase